MKNALSKMVRAGAMDTFTLRYYSPEVDAVWTIDDEQIEGGSLQIVYQRDIRVNNEDVSENFWMHLTPEDAVAIGALLSAWGHAKGGEQ